MSRLIFVPQYPGVLRYQSWWYSEFMNQFQIWFDEVIRLGDAYLQVDSSIASNSRMFSPLEQAIHYEQIQAREFLKLDLYDDDVLFLADLSFPGFFSNVLFHKRPSKCFSFCHATSKNSYDYFQPVRKSKWAVETGHSKLFDKIFVATNYHKDKLKGWGNVEVIGLPNPPFLGYRSGEKVIEIISVARPSIQKINKKLENAVEKQFGNIVRTSDYNFTNYSQYYDIISRSKVMLITCKEETYSYAVVDAILNEIIPVAPKRFSFPELLPHNCLYEEYQELKVVLEFALGGEMKVPKLKTAEMAKNFYKNICESMKGE